MQGDVQKCLCICNLSINLVGELVLSTKCTLLVSDLPLSPPKVATAILGGYFGLFLLVKIKFALSSSPAVEAAPVAASAGAIPDVDSEEFGAFLESEENVGKLIESWEK